MLEEVKIGNLGGGGTPFTTEDAKAMVAGKQAA
jgi:hypothetical protein